MNTTGTTSKNGGRGRKRTVLPKPRWEAENLQHFQRGHSTQFTGALRRQSEVSAYLAANNVTLKGIDNPSPWITLQESTFDKTFLECLNGFGVLEPSPVQAVLWPLILEGFDLIVTGSHAAKSLDAVVPALAHVRAAKELKTGKGPLALIIAPTDELAGQMYDVAEKFSKALDVTCAFLNSGDSKCVKRDTQLMLTTPSQLIEQLRSRKISDLKQVSYIVFIDVDKMVKTQEFCQVLDHTPPNRKVTMVTSSSEDIDVSTMKTIHSIVTKYLTLNIVEVNYSSRALICESHTSRKRKNADFIESRGVSEKTQKRWNVIVDRFPNINISMFTRRENALLEYLIDTEKRTWDISTPAKIYGMNTMTFHPTLDDLKHFPAYAQRIWNKLGKSYFPFVKIKLPVEEKAIPLWTVKPRCGSDLEYLQDFKFCKVDLKHTTEASELKVVTGNPINARSLTGTLGVKKIVEVIPGLYKTESKIKSTSQQVQSTNLCEYFKNSVEGSFLEDGDAEDYFWKNVMTNEVPYMYGLSAKPSPLGSVFQIDNIGGILNHEDPIEGVSTPYLYAGEFQTFSEVHTEDGELYSVNHLRGGNKKLWYGIGPDNAVKFVEAVRIATGEKCKGFMRHKNYLASPEFLAKHGIHFFRVIQEVGEIILTFPGGLHQVVNFDKSLAIAINFATADWIPYGVHPVRCCCYKKYDIPIIQMADYVKDLFPIPQG